MISIVLPIYNQEKFIEKCLMSIKNQTYDDFEVLMINDGSTDNSESICLKFTYDTRFSYYKQSNGGVSMARNLGIKKSKGDWLCFIDPDDLIAPNFLISLLQYTQEEIDIVASGYSTYSDEKIVGSFDFYKSSFYARNQSEKLVLYYQLLDGQYQQDATSVTAIGVPWGKLYRRSFIIQNKIIFPENQRRMQDNLFNMIAFEKARCVKYFKGNQYYYRIDNITNYRFGKYDKYAKENFLMFQTTRIKYLSSHSYFDDAELKKKHYNEILNQFKYVIFSEIVQEKRGKGIADLFSLFKSPIVSYVRNSKLNSINNLINKSLLLTIKKDNVRLCYALFYVLSLLRNLKNRIN